MRYVDFRDSIQKELKRCPKGQTWKDLKECLDLPYKTPCSEWVARLETEIGLTRTKGEGRALVWKVPRDKKVKK
jgi:hypothetical protein